MADESYLIIFINFLQAWLPTSIDSMQTTEQPQQDHAEQGKRDHDFNQGKAVIHDL